MKEMNNLINLLAGLLFMAGLYDVTAEGHTKSVSYAKIPRDNLLMFLTDFERYIVDKQMAEMYFGILKPPAFEPDKNYHSTIVKVPNSSNYTQVTIGETPGSNSRCARGNVNLAPVNGDKTLFYREDDKKTVQAIWSSVPSKYIWSMRCSNYYPSKRKCLFVESVFGLYVHGNLDDLPFTSVIGDICKATGVKFGAENFKWFYSFGENTLC